MQDSQWRDDVNRTLGRLEQGQKDLKKTLDNHCALPHGNPHNPNNRNNSWVTRRNAGAAGGVVGLIALAQVLREIFLGG